MAIGCHPKVLTCHRYPPNSRFVPHHLSSRLIEYTATLLYIPGLYLVKLAVLNLVKTITRKRYDDSAVYSVAALIVLWVITGEYAAAFMCHVPNTWDWPNAYMPSCTSHHLYTDQELACLRELPRVHEHDY